MDYMYSKLKLNAMSGKVYQFFIQQFIWFAEYEIKRKSSLVYRIDCCETSTKFYFHERL